ncbi:MAG: hypothetical protein JSR76_01240 [Verrucomicrobia bacterium]|nr:hypothetical protein [Verrucomicrobiota bacterium]
MSQATSSTNLITWIDAPQEIDKSFLEEVPIVPTKTAQAIVSPFLENALDKLFNFSDPDPWALFTPFAGYGTGLKRLFKRKVLSSFSTDIAREILDNFHEGEGENQDEGEAQEGEKIYEMLSSLENLNEILEQITLGALRALRS